METWRSTARAERLSRFLISADIFMMNANDYDAGGKQEDKMFGSNSGLKVKNKNEVNLG